LKQLQSFKIREHINNPMNTQLSELLEPIAAWFRSLNTPEPIVHWGHPVMMGIVVVFMGGYAAIAGWRSRTSTDSEVVDKNRAEHRKVAPLMLLFIAMGYTGGVLSLVMQKQPILESPHFVTGSIALLLLGLNGAISLSGFIGNKEILRTIHAYVGSAALILLVVHAVFGVQLGLSI
jgi:fucose 4-O-acetylase-like acetyltransferase